MIMSVYTQSVMVAIMAVDLMVSVLGDKYGCSCWCRYFIMIIIVFHAIVWVHYDYDSLCWWCQFMMMIITVNAEDVSSWWWIFQFMLKTSVHESEYVCSCWRCQLMMVNMSVHAKDVSSWKWICQFMLKMSVHDSELCQFMLKTSVHDSEYVSSCWRRQFMLMIIAVHVDVTHSWWLLW